MKKIITIVASVVMMLGLALMPASAEEAAAATTAADCMGLNSSQTAACSACLAENGASWDDTAGTCSSPSAPGGLNGIIQTIINVMLFIIGILCVVMIIFGGIRFTTSTGDQSRTKAARDTIIYAVVGLIVAIVAFALVQWVFSALKG